MPNKKENKKDKNTMSSFLKDAIVVILAALVLAFVLRTFVVDSRIVPTASMYPTVEVNDRILVNRFIYRFTDIERGDIIVFKAEAETGQKEDLLKRVIALPGETVKIVNQAVYIDGEPLEEPYLVDYPGYDFAEVTVPEGKLFVLGDNRNNSNDSHHWSYPFIDITDVKGKAFLVYWPFEHFKLLK